MRQGSVVIPALAAITIAGALQLDAGPSARLAHARYLAIGYNVGTGIVGELDVNPDVLPEEREAARRIHDSINSWGRYVVVDRATRADVLLTLRKGRLGSAGGRVGTGGPGAAPGAPSAKAPQRPNDPLVGSQFTSTDDLMEAFDPDNGDLLWRATRANGLTGEVPALLEAFRSEVAKADGSPKKP